MDGVEVLEWYQQRAFRVMIVIKELSVLEFHGATRLRDRQEKITQRNNNENDTVTNQVRC